MIEILKAVLYGIVEGITEWLPVSSTGHLILLDEFLSLNVSPDPVFRAEFGQMFEVVIQLGAILAVAVSFFKVLWPFGSSKSAVEKKSTWRLWLNICIASIPAAAVGIVLDKIIENATGKDIDGWIYNATVVASALIIYGVLFIVIERVRKDKTPVITSVHDIKPHHAILIGVFQMLAIIPGTSRSGSTILGSMMLGLSRGAAAEFSFFLAIPAMAGASLIKGLGFVSYVAESGADVSFTAIAVLIVASLTAFLVSMAAIKFLTDFVKKHSFAAFGYYRIALGAAVLLWFILN
ncbi:MAG: undecaprenyl-diphosphate phosphatase [Clostridia bacterium]|nr:undecaprenyl-diphosphate phosphatase [Clostridia bacterium]